MNRLVVPGQAGCAEVPIHKSRKEFAYRTVSVHHHYQTPPSSASSPPNSPNSIKHQAPRGLLHRSSTTSLWSTTTFLHRQCFYTRNKNLFQTKNLLHQTAFALVTTNPYNVRYSAQTIRCQDRSEHDPSQSLHFMLRRCIVYGKPQHFYLSKTPFRARLLPRMELGHQIETRACHES